MKDGSIFVYQAPYILDILDRFKMTDCKPASVPMQPGIELQRVTKCDDKFPFPQLVGALLFLARLTRPDIAYAVGKLSQFMGSFDKSHWEAGKVLLRYLQCTRNLGLFYKSGEKLVITGYADSDYAGDVTDRKSTSV